MKSASFRFHDSLNDFLPWRRKFSVIRYEFYIAPTVKDAIESMGVPHPEVDVILVNKIAVDFDYHLHEGDAIEVYPVSVKHGTPIKFILDVHLGSLARMLRLLGFDTLYQNYYEDKVIVQIAVTENRIILTRDVLLLKHKVIRSGYWLRSQHTYEQTTEVIKYFGLTGRFRPFSRCLECNGLIMETTREEVEGKVPLQVSQDFDEFFTCSDCLRVYWKGSHYDKMKLVIERFRDV
ncbi:Mut7-C RNAse domain-containing protein [Flavihumibacter solisilvae]|uniref:Twitching motility protein PilT n=1 Tax=Flavihumibacter solisilvae TaxID=1349421 RepID=A0A0C1ISY2_9BACT|nr:Mut7-C RNAse domain-containing protein [Flavihumibacter solisilvae]KIC93514.1 hypothetical protein OI18_17320 [Flavihumibacter solisilvae]